MSEERKKVIKKQRRSKKKDWQKKVILCRHCGTNGGILNFAIRETVSVLGLRTDLRASVLACVYDLVTSFYYSVIH
jgi:hypothetical protein